MDEQKIPVPFATVSLIIKASDTLAKRNVISNNTGEFSISDIRNGIVEITISSVGFTPWKQTISFEQSHAVNLTEIVLHDDRQTLSGVTISAKKPLIQQKTDRLIMNVQGSVLASGNNAYDILAMAPSVQLMNGKLTMDGKSNVLILLNGKRLPGATLESILGSLSGEQIERIEFISNPSSKYDANASGGVIEIYTKRNSQMGWTSNVSGNVARGYRTGGGGDADFRLSTKKWDFGVSAGYSQKGHIERGYSNRELYQGKNRIGDFTQQMDISKGSMIDKSLNGSIGYQLNKNNSFGADVNLIKSKLNGSGNLDAVINENQNRLITNTFNDVLLQVGFSNYNIFYKAVLDSLGSNFLTTANYARYTSGQQQEFKQSTLDESTGNIGNSQFRNNAPAKYDIYTGTADYTKNFSSSAKLEAGLKYTLTENHSNQVTEVFQDGAWTDNNSGLRELGYSEKIYAGYINFNQKVGKFSFQAGLRAEQSSYKVTGGIDSSYFNLFPNLRIDYKVSKVYSSSIGYARNINRPSYDNLIPYELFIDNYTVSRGNAFLRPEYKQTFSWNHLYKKYSLRLAYTRTTDALASTMIYDENTFRFIQTQSNFLNQNLFSAALSIPVKIASWWDMNNRATLYFKDLKYPSVFDNNEILTRSKTYYALNTLNTFTFNDGLSAEISAYYNSPSINGIYSYGGYSNVSAGIKKTVLAGKGSVKLDVSDIFYNNNILISTNIIPIVTSGINRMDTRRVRLSFRYSFGGNESKKREKSNTQGNTNEINRLKL
ncbi:hypothetical protein TH53_09780 [Pedobacter lusitanus]|uniref:Outer membrane protein beta-barrel domain-containing protein n=1 Tax=Pedobacter lusitanus TaxID=1503925 RepID=A0A0D0GJI1_9SPHI|nr:hypothetical protein TH53_09780 [Pedobacter lusitanus]